MIELLQKFNYETINLLPYNDNTLEVIQSSDSFILFVSGEQWNNYNYITHSEAFQIFSHYYLARGHCICTGLGFGIRENWLLKNPNVSKVTVLEKNRCVIDYHKKMNNNFINQIEIINCDANEYKGSCDTLLIDHYEQESDQYFIESLQKISYNIICKQMWAWSIEPIILKECYDKSLLEAYNHIKSKYELDLPIISCETLQLFLFMFYMHESVAFRTDRHGIKSKENIVSYE